MHQNIRRYYAARPTVKFDLGASPPDPLHARSRGPTIPAPLSWLTRVAAARRTDDGRGGPSRAAPASLEIGFALGRERITPPACPPFRGLPEAAGTADARQLEKPGFTAVPNSDRVVSLRSASGPGACDRRCPVPGTHVACCFDSAPAPAGRTVQPTHASCPAAGSTAG